ncbi:MAG: hypothetical protein OXU76_02900 [Alphaproteobacteria bacterium]|nr:hypothetical protein [Alphaproteobacteria bacterium]
MSKIICRHMQFVNFNRLFTPLFIAILTLVIVTGASAQQQKGRKKQGVS